jgi:hypothetical protein
MVSIFVFPKKKVLKSLIRRVMSRNQDQEKPSLSLKTQQLLTNIVLFNLGNLVIRLKNNKIELDEFEFRQTKDHEYADQISDPKTDTNFKLKVKHLYFTERMAKYLLLNKFQFIVSILKNNINISSLCDQTNFYVDLKFLESFYDEFFKGFVENQKTPTTTATGTDTTSNVGSLIRNLINKRQLFLAAKFTKSYLTFQQSSELFHIIGFETLLVKYTAIKTHFSSDKHIEIVSNDFILTTTKNFRNYYSTKKRTTTNRHYYNTIFNMDKLELKYHLSLDKSHLNLTSNATTCLEYDSRHTITLVNMLAKYEKLFDFVVHQIRRSPNAYEQQQQQAIQSKKSDIKIHFQTVNVFYRFNEKLVMLLNLNRIDMKESGLNSDKIQLIRYLMATQNSTTGDRGCTDTFFDLNDNFSRTTSGCETVVVHMDSANLIDRLENITYLSLIDLKVSLTFSLVLMLLKTWETLVDLLRPIQRIVTGSNGVPDISHETLVQQEPSEIEFDR